MGLKDWCKGMKIDPKNCILVQGVPEGFDEGTIESTLEERIAKCVVHGRMFQRGEGTYVVLCEFDKVMEPLSVPRDPLFSRGMGKGFRESTGQGCASPP
uniref:Paraneoplastic antigen Ma-like N-terminal domain-containing protein n=1 Tax=Pelusios castaneus TaxID=367368 RepID=A0A8C8R5K3_9SAUR